MPDKKSKLPEGLLRMPMQAGRPVMELGAWAIAQHNTRILKKHYAKMDQSTEQVPDVVYPEDGE